MTLMAMGKVKVGPEQPHSWEGNGLAFTASDSTYQARYWFGGMWPFIHGDDPLVTFSAPGCADCRFKLLGAELPLGVTRTRCAPPKALGCFVVDVALVPIAPGEQR
jgi:hypothetical protein